MSLTHRLAYVTASIALLLTQHLAVWSVIRSSPAANFSHVDFWTTPLAYALEVAGPSTSSATLLVCLSIAVAGVVAWLSARAARKTGAGIVAVILTMVPAIQLAAILAIAFRPASEKPAERPDPRTVQGVFAGAAIIVAAMVLSAGTFGSYGWGLFVFTPFLASAATALLANLDRDIGFVRSFWLAFTGLCVGSAGLLVFALEGIVCILMAAPLAMLVALPGAALGRMVASIWHDPGKPFYSLAILPLIFALEAAIPPASDLETQMSVEIDAPPEAVWQAILSDRPIGGDPGLPALGGLAYPISARTTGEGEGARRIGHFSTGNALEEITAWEEHRTLAYRVIEQPPMMEEMSPYRRVHAPHVHGYFDTGETRFELQPLAGGGTRLILTSEHVLRIDPLLYWEPFAKLAISENVSRVLEDIERKAQRAR